MFIPFPAGVGGSLHRIAVATLLLLLVLSSEAAMAQSLRYVTGSFVDIEGRFDPYWLTTTITLAGTRGRMCGPNQTPMDPCQGSFYPFVAEQNVAPVRPTGAIQQAGLSVGDPVNMPLKSEWTRQTS